MTQQIFHFDNYIVRPVGEQDRAYLDSLIEGDEYHRDNMTPDFFLELVPGEDAWAMEDEHGKVVFYFKTQTAVRLSMLIPEPENSKQKAHNQVAMLKGLAWVEAILRHNHFREILFDTAGPELRAMAKRRMGFRETTGDLSRPIEPQKPQMVPVERWGTSPQDLRREG